MKASQRLTSQANGPKFTKNLLFLPWDPIKAILKIKIWKNLNFQFSAKSAYFWIGSTKRARNDPNGPWNLQKPNWYVKNISNYWFQAKLGKKIFPYQKCTIHLCRLFLNVKMLKCQNAKMSIGGFCWKLKIQIFSNFSFQYGLNRVPWQK